MKQRGCFLVHRSSGKTYSLSGRIATIGSAPASHISLENTHAPQHCGHILFKGGSFSFQVLTHEIDIAVNGKKVRSRIILNPEDTIRIGAEEFYFSDTHGISTDTLHDSARQPQSLMTLIEVVVSLLKKRDEPVYHDLVIAVARLLKCDAARLVIERDDGQRETIARFPDAAGIERFSKRAIDWAHERGRTILMHESDWLQEVDMQASLIKNEIATVLCTPLQSLGKTIGYVYLDRLRMSKPFVESDRAFCDVLMPLFAELVTNYAEHVRQQEAISRLQEATLDGASGLMYEDASMHNVVELARKVSGTTMPVLILGETGTGKEVFARFIHAHSNRSDKPFKAINCGALPENLIETELFGHEKGAFTNAHSRKIGLFEYADGGTILLDEIGELPPTMQVKLLRALQESEITRVGANEAVNIDVRILAATNRDLALEVAEGRFREDLYFRINVVQVMLPPLRDRGRDAILLAEYFLRKFGRQFGFQEKKLSHSAVAALLWYHWPGNIRELENTIQKALLLSSGNSIEDTDLSISDPSSKNPGIPSTAKMPALKEIKAAAEKAAIIDSLKRTSGNVSLSARLLDVDRKWLTKLISEHEIHVEAFRPAKL
ncbi:MAG: GAF domain-containing protein [Chitinivibrionales bacterium]|nr:GAF domain-containing protein [Chitinivibrionales bacterium]